MLVVGLTGSISTGKSTVSGQLKSLGFPVVDADLVARQVVEPGQPALRHIVKTFGSHVILPDGTLDRKALNQIVFSDEKNRRKLERIMHPRIRRIMLWQIIKHWLHGERVCILDVPLLVEGGLWRYCGKVVVVYCPPEVQIQRLMSRDGYTEKEALARIKSQMSISRKADYADDLLDNSGNREHAKVQVVRLARQLDAEAGWFWKVNWLLPPVGVISGTICLLRRYLTIKIPSG